MIIYDRKELTLLCEKWKQEGKIIITTNGCFDILHAGHVEFLEKAKALGDVLVVGINTDESIVQLKGNKRPINLLKDRVKVLDSIRFVDLVHPFSELLPNAFLECVKPNIHVKGGDYNVDQLPEKEVVERYGGKIRIIPLKKGYSTTSLIYKILEKHGGKM
jgi:rfaE bifunctional protein nucleotidyltransferase chain/domain